jgi:hypothetical protein
MRTLTVVGVLAFAGFGCATTFYGAPKIEGGRARCEQVCADWQMELAGMVRMGEYSDGCVCQVPGKMIAPQAAAAAGQAAAAGVWTQEQARRETAVILSTSAHR